MVANLRKLITKLHSLPLLSSMMNSQSQGLLRLNGQDLKNLLALKDSLGSKYAIGLSLYSFAFRAFKAKVFFRYWCLFVSKPLIVFDDMRETLSKYRKGFLHHLYSKSE